MKNTKVRALADAAVATALCTLLTAVSVYVPGFAVIVSLFCGLPIMFVTLKYGIYFGIISAVASYFTGFIITGDAISIMVLLVMYILPATVFGAMLYKNKSFFSGVAAASVIVLVGFVVQLIFFNTQGGGLAELFATTTMQILDGIRLLLAVNPEFTSLDIDNTLQTISSAAVDTMLLYMPSVAIIFSMVSAYIISVIGVFFSRRLKVRDVPKVKFNKIRASRASVVAFFLSFAVTFFSENGGVVVYAFHNIQLLSMLAIAVTGIACIDTVLERKINKGILRGLIYAAILVIGFMLISFVIDLLVLVGLFGINSSLRFPEKEEDDNGKE